MLRQALRSLAWSDPAAGTAELLERTGIDPTARAEELHVPQFVALANAYEELRAGQ
jgi:16S rRNA A1518/A1519 N6-dimethyltransferase RsmA/KsgA/DIM1 with predicted DNA glycosylase/AP lyase activity